MADYHIIDTKTGKVWKTKRGKSSWTKESFAKSAWTNSNYMEPPFKEQERFIIKKILTESARRLQEAISLLDSLKINDLEEALTVKSFVEDIRNTYGFE